MAKGRINMVVPPQNSKVGLIDRTDIADPAPYVFQIPDGLSDPTYIPAVGDAVVFTPGPGHTASSVQKDVPPFVIVSFSAVASGSAGAVSHTLTWVTTGAASGKIRYWRNDNGALTDIDITPNVNSGTLTIQPADIADSRGYTIIIYDGPNYTGNSLNKNAQV